MLNFDQNWKVVDLQNECKKRISFGTIQENNINNENELVEVEIALPSNFFNHNEHESDSEEHDVIVNENSKRVNCVYFIDGEYDSGESAKSRIEQEGFWKFLRFRLTKEGLKEIYYCNTSSECKKKIYILYHEESTNVSIWSRNIEHDHPSEKKKFGINNVTKKTIEMLYKSSVTTATRIKYALRERLEPFKPKKFENDPETPNDLYIPGIEIPKLLQIKNFLNNNLKPRLSGRSSKEKFSYGDLDNWLNSNSLVPDNDHEPFLIDSFIQINEKVLNASTTRLSISTKSFLKIAMKAKHCCADATYKLIWHNFPVFLTGNPDSLKTFHPFLHIDYKPEALIADGAEAIMGWAHVHRTVEQRTKSLENSKQIRADIDLLRISPNTKFFELAYNLFKKKMEQH
ncbi:unnamed protein product [Brachionus calyciflorus]|uniref:Uncharacterized protein n=1 Tax=Brachionus calyciflorus TaxID=104777 RepID=A0A814M8M9_9BILA|nr:unnamed protein product [Brachionus calyciflorus]